MKKILFFGLMFFVIATQAQTKKTVPVKKAPVKSQNTINSSNNGAKKATTVVKNSNITPVPAKPVTVEKPLPSEHVVTKQEQQLYDDYHKTQEGNYKEQFELKSNKTKYNNVVKLNFMGLFFGGVNFEYERKIAKKNAIVLTAGYYAYGLLQGGARAGIDAKQYLGKSIAPKGMFVSLGSLYNFNPSKANSGLINLRGLVGHQSQNGHFTFEIAGGPAYTFLLTDTGNLSDPDTKYKIGLLPAFKLSLGYAF